MSAWRGPGSGGDENRRVGRGKAGKGRGRLVKVPPPWGQVGASGVEPAEGRSKTSTKTR